MAIVGTGWELHVQRIGLHRRGTKVRTYGAYQAYLNGVAIPGLSGFVCETIGPGDNTASGIKKRRIEAKRYPLWTQFGRYVSKGYASDAEPAGQEPMPGFRLAATGDRTAILVHPGHPPTLYLSSVGCLNPTQALLPDESMNYWDSRGRVIALLDSLAAFRPTAFQHEAATAITGAFLVVDGEPMNELSAPSPTPLFAVASSPSALAASGDLPISKASAIACAKWLKTNFEGQLKAAVKGKAYGVKHLCAIVCQETAYKWVKWIDTKSVQEIVERAVYDASGDYPGAPRTASPRNTDEFRKDFGDAFTGMLIEEANKTRRLQGFSDKQWVYKGYGLFQYDLQHVYKDEAFFRDRQWYSFENCLARCVSELDEKLKARNDDLWAAIKAYNGSGPRAENYKNNVMVFASWCGEVVGN